MSELFVIKDGTENEQIKKFDLNQKIQVLKQFFKDDNISYKKEVIEKTEETIKKARKELIKRVLKRLPWVILFFAAPIIHYCYDNHSYYWCAFWTLVSIGILVIDISSYAITFEDFNNCLTDLLVSLKERSLKKHSLDESQLISQTVMIPFVDGSRYLDNKIQKIKSHEMKIIKVGKIKIILYSIFKIRLLDFTEDFISIYDCDINLLSGNTVSNEKTNEVYYKDISSISQKNNETLFVSNSGYELKIPDSMLDSVGFITGLAKMTSRDDLPGTDLETAINGIKKFVREKKV